MVTMEKPRFKTRGNVKEGKTKRKNGVWVSMDREKRVIRDRDIWRNLVMG
jgi:hypothetical protein